MESGISLVSGISLILIIDYRSKSGASLRQAIIMTL